MLAGKFRIESMGSLATAAFYGVVGVLLLVAMTLSNFPPHIALLGITSIVAAYGILKKRFWSTWLIVALFFVVTALTIYTAYYTASFDLLTTIGMIAYLVLTWIFTGYAVKTRPKND